MDPVSSTIISTEAKCLVCCPVLALPNIRAEVALGASHSLPVGIVLPESTVNRRGAHRAEQLSPFRCRCMLMFQWPLTNLGTV